ncbi:glycosyltransferase family 4 protein [Ferrovibrio sp.]|uniref:glycosyltransferase family 4 protein n=1 Tax=Ferrovibrio sp. TaxID=1917215 RepID=UPI00311E69A9
MHILLATTGYPPDHSGSGGRLHGMYSRLQAANPDFRWSVITKRRQAGTAPVAGPDHIAAYTAGGNEYPRLGAAVLENLWLLRQLAAGLLRDVDIVHAAGWTWMTPLLLFVARRKGIPIIREMTTPGDPGGDSLGGRIVRWTNSLADRIIAISPALEGKVRAVQPNIPIWCRPNGVDSVRFRCPDEESRLRARAVIEAALPQASPDDPVVLHVGRIRPLKNQLFLAECLARLPARFHLLLAGPAFGDADPYVAELRARLSMPDLSGRAALLEENVRDVDILMQGADIFAFPSVAEGLGTVMVEALCAGLPVVASRIPGVTDWIIKDGRNGYVADIDDLDFCNALLKAEALRERRQEIAGAAGQIYRQEIMDDGYRQLFAQMRRR